MFANLQRIFKFHIKDNTIYYIFILCGFVCGGIIAAACVFGLQDLDFKELCVYFDDFFNSINNSGSDHFEVFRLSVLENLKFFVILLSVSLMVVGSLFVPLFSAVSGYSFFFTLFFIFKAYSFKGTLLFLSAVLPHQLIYFPCVSLALVLSMSFSVSLIKERNDIKSKILKYIVKMSLLFFVSVFASLLQGYIEPVLIRLLAPVFIS